MAAAPGDRTSPENPDSQRPFYGGSSAAHRSISRWRASRSRNSGRSSGSCRPRSSRHSLTVCVMTAKFTRSSNSAKSRSLISTLSTLFTMSTFRSCSAREGQSPRSIGPLGQGRALWGSWHTPTTTLRAESPEVKCPRWETSAPPALPTFVDKVDGLHAALERSSDSGQRKRCRGQPLASGSAGRCFCMATSPPPSPASAATRYRPSTATGGTHHRRPWATWTSGRAQHAVGSPGKPRTFGPGGVDSPRISMGSITRRHAKDVASMVTPTRPTGATVPTPRHAARALLATSAQRWQGMRHRQRGGHRYSAVPVAVPAPVAPAP
jgi:hypothetical protein